jgi:hypothetical protein
MGDLFKKPVAPSEPKKTGSEGIAIGSEGERTVDFRREFAQVDSREIWTDGQKWEPLYHLLERSKGKADTLVIEAPQVLGDTWREFVVNLAAIANTGLKIFIKPGKRVVGRVSIERPVKMVEVESDSPQLLPKTGKGILRIGRKPSIVLMSYAPDELYAQAELLVMLEKEEYKPSSEGREIEGCYETGPGTIDSFFQDWIEKPDDLKLLEAKRQEIVEKGWSKLTYGSLGAAKPQDVPKGTLRHRMISKDAPLTRDDDLHRAAVEDMKKCIAKDEKFVCAACMEEQKDSLFEGIGFMGVDGIERPAGKLKALPYPVCKKCASLSRERLFSKVEENLHAYGKSMQNYWKEKDAQKNEIDGAIKIIDSMIDDPRLPLFQGIFEHPEKLGVTSLVDATYKVKALSEEISKTGHFICICCLHKKKEKHLDSIGSHFPKDVNERERERRTQVYPICDKCTQLPPGEMTEMAEKNLKERKA